MAPRTRREVYSLPNGDQTLVWYARAVKVMKTRPITNPTSWRYQAAIHEYTQATDPLRVPGEALPSLANRTKFWTQCQHSSWYFLPWHRIYLHYFEEIVASVVKSLDGPADWTLPYWNYSLSTATAKKVPPAFLQANFEGAANPLLAPRSGPASSGNIMALQEDVDVDCLLVSPFAGSALGGNTGFGGPQTAFNHGSGPNGALESVPHGSIHSRVGGWMGRFNTAGLDPLFYLHHANIDRLWQVWLDRDPANLNPTLNSWNSFKFAFHNASKAVVQLTPSQVVDTTSALLNYEYDDVNDPFATAMVQSVTDTVSNPEMAGATEAPITINDTPTTASLAVGTASSARTAERTVDDWAGAIYLNIENIRGEAEAPSYAVYINLPAGADPENDPEACRQYYAGLLPMFGLVESTQQDPNAGGLHYALEVGSLIRRLNSAGNWNPDDLRVTFVPRHLDDSAARVAATPVEVGRVSLYFA